MIDPEQLIKLIYEGVGDDAAWNDALATVAELVRAAGAGLGIQDMRTHEFRSLGYFGIDGSLNPTYWRLAPSNRIWQEIAVRREALTDQMVVRKPEFMRTELYADWFAPQRFHSVMAAPTLFENDDVASWIVSGVAPDAANPWIVSLPKPVAKTKFSEPLLVASMVWVA